MSIPTPPPRPPQFPWMVYIILLVVILLFTIAPFFMMVSDPGLGVMLVITAPLGMGALIVWAIVLIIHYAAWSRHRKAYP